MTAQTLLERGREYFAENGVVRTVGSIALYCGQEINDRCEMVYQIRREDRGQDHPLSLRAQAARHGLSAHLYLLFGVEDTATDRYLRSTIPIRDLNDGHIEAIHDKYTFQLLTEPYVSSLPTLYGTLDGGTFNSTPVSPECDGLFDALERARVLVLKPAEGKRGNGIHILRWGEDGEKIHVNGTPTERAAVAEFATELRGYVVTEFVEQHPYAAAVYPDAVNTVRLFSIVDPETGTPSVARAVHRFGSVTSAPTDNWSGGGYCAPVDVDTGTIERLVVIGDRARSKRVRHPETDARVAGVEIPYWKEACDLVRAAADLHRDAPIVGWDVVVADDGPVLVEGNARPGVDLLQVKDGILENPRVRRLLASGGVSG